MTDTIDSITFHLDLVTPSQNVYQRWHWNKQRKWKQDAMWIVKAAILKCRSRCASLAGPSFATLTEFLSGKERWFVTINFHRFGAKLLDYGNLVGGCKPLLDCFVDSELLVDDSPKWCKESYGQTVDPKNKRTEVTISWQKKSNV